MGDLDRGIEILNDVVQQEPSNREAADLLASAQERKNKKNIMKESFKSFLNF